MALENLLAALQFGGEDTPSHTVPWLTARIPNRPLPPPAR